MSTLACPGVWALWPHTVIRDSALHASAVDTVGVHGRPPFISCPGVSALPCLTLPLLNLACCRQMQETQCA